MHALNDELPSGELESPGHVLQLVALVAPIIVEYESAGQFVQLALPELFLNFPATQVVQPPPSGPLYPALHLQELIPGLRLAELVFVGHVAHVST